jgi:SSS family solute:Na+ symporter
VILGVLWVPFIHLINSQLYVYLQSVQAYISPPIAVCFIFGILWPRMNSQGAFSSLMTGFVMGSARFVLEVMDKTHSFSSSGIRWMLDMNFLHYAVFMFVVCAAVMVIVSLTTPAPDLAKLAGLTFATAEAKLDTTPVGKHFVIAPESAVQHRMNVAMSGLLVLTVVALWIYFR